MCLKHPKIRFKCFIVMVSMILSGSQLIMSAPLYETLWTNLLTTHTNKTFQHRTSFVGVDYAKFQESQSFRSLLRYLETIDLSEFKTPSENIAFWVNAHNICSVKMVLANHPIDAKSQSETLFKQLWKTSYLNVKGVFYSLVDIENQLYQMSKDPRIIFSLHKATISSPDLYSHAFTADRLTTQLDEQMQLFLTNKSKGLSYDNNTKMFTLSQLFLWYKDIFSPTHKSVIHFIQSQKLFTKQVENPATRYYIYHWKLNDRQSTR